MKFPLQAMSGYLDLILCCGMLNTNFMHAELAHQATVSYKRLLENL